MTRTPNPSCSLHFAEACTNATGPRPKTEHVPGVLYANPPGVDNGRLWPSEALNPFIEHFWWVRWNVREPRVADVLSYPSVHVVFEGGGARIVGVVRRMFSRTLTGAGRVFAIKFRPGMFRSLHHVSAWTLTDRELPLGNQLGTSAAELARELPRLPNDIERAKLLERCLLATLPAPEADSVLARNLVDQVRRDAAIRSVAVLASESGLPARALQRLFREYVGVSPKWVVRRFRLQEASELLRRHTGSIADIAAALGYFDQAHFVRDFKAVVGATPSEYVSRSHKGG